MKANVSRLTIFAILVALEEDARAAIVASYSTDEITGALPPDLKSRLIQRAGDAGEDDTTDVLTLIDYSDFGDAPVLIRRLNASGREIKPMIELAELLEPLVPTRNRVMHSRPLDVDDLSRTVSTMDRALQFVGVRMDATRITNRRLREDPAYVLSLSIPSADPDTSVLHNLPLPDYDETGLIGREEDRAALKTLLFGHHPVISVIGEGGYGKTALAVQVLFDILDDPNCPFEAMVWTSLKTRTLSGAAGVREVADAVKSTVALYGSMQKTLGLSETGGLESIFEFATAFPTLFVIDNLETINAGEIRDLLVRLPYRSKVLITSRIGVGEMELRRQVTALAPKACAMLMRRVAKLQNALHLAEAENERLIDYAQKLYLNPLAIKWFVNAVAHGKSPSITAKNSWDLLRFCFDNVYGYLQEDARKVLSLMLVARRPLTIAELAFLTEEDGIDYLRVVNELLATSIVRPETDRRSRRVAYGLTDSAGDFLRKFHSPSTPQYQLFNTRLQRLVQLKQEGLQAAEISPHDPRALTPNSANPDEIIAAAWLRMAIDACWNDRRDDAVNLVERAREVAPYFVDVNRVAGYIYARFQEFYEAENEYATAYRNAPESITVLNSYAAFILSYMPARLELAVELTDKAAAINELPDTLILRGRARMYVSRFDDSLADFEKVLSPGLKADFKQYVIASKHAAECSRRAAERSIRAGDLGAIARISQSFGYIIAAKRLGRIDAGLQGQALKTLRELVFVTVRDDNVQAIVSTCELLLHEWSIFAEQEQPEAKRLLDQLTIKVRLVDVDAAEVISVFRARPGGKTKLKIAQRSVDLSAERFGVIDVIEHDKAYGFVREADGERFYFNNASVKNAYFAALRIGDVVKFRAVFDVKGRRRVSTALVWRGDVSAELREAAQELRARVAAGVAKDTGSR